MTASHGCVYIDRTMQNRDTNPAVTIYTEERAQLFWDTQCEPEDHGWSLRYRTTDGNEHHAEIKGDEKSSIEGLAYRVRREITHIELGLCATWSIDVFASGGHKRGSITINPSKGGVTLRSELNWSYT